MAIKGYSTFPKIPTLLEPHNQIFQCHIQDAFWGVLTHSAEMQFVFSAVPADRAKCGIENITCGDILVSLNFSCAITFTFMVGQIMTMSSSFFLIQLFRIIFGLVGLSFIRIFFLTIGLSETSYFKVIFLMLEKMIIK